MKGNSVQYYENSSMHATKHITNIATKPMDPICREVMNEASGTPPPKRKKMNPVTTRTADPINDAINDVIHGFSNGILFKNLLLLSVIAIVFILLFLKSLPIRFLFLII
jgi:hypothetical protein